MSKKYNVCDKIWSRKSKGMDVENDENGENDKLLE
jgi:hypothetical protein